MSDNNERYDMGTEQYLEELEKVYFQEADPATTTEPSVASARRRTPQRSTPRRRSASNASHARMPQKSHASNPSSGVRRPFAGKSQKKPKRGKKNTPPARSRTATAAAATEKGPEKLVFNTLPPEGYANSAEQSSPASSAHRHDSTGKKAFEKGSVYFSDTKRSMQNIRRRTAENAYRRRKAMKGMTAGQKVSYTLAQIGPTVRGIQADPKRREAAYKIIVVLVALLLAIHWSSCMNDILGFARSDKEKVVVVEEGDTTNKLIGKFDRAGLVKHSIVCKLFISATSDIRNDNGKYLKGEFTLTPDMGVEKMLATCTATQKRDTVEITVPEGFTIEQIAEKLEENKICGKSDFLKAANAATYKFSFVKEIKNGDQRYHLLEGYMYPDTYEFYVGQDASSVVARFLDNFNQKWSESYAQRANDLKMSVDDVITLASIVQKEDSNPDNMAIIASVFYNRLNSSSFPSLQSDATNYYVNTFIKPYASAGDYNLYRNRYSTYVCQGLPVGAISNPGDDAIKSVLWPASTNYYFFAHDDDGKLYAARTASEQNQNVYNALTSSDNQEENVE